MFPWCKVCYAMVSKTLNIFILQCENNQPLRNWVFATNSIFVIPISLQPDDVNLWYFKLTLRDLRAFIVWKMGCNDIEIIKSEFVAKT